MSFYTSLTGLNAATAQLSVTSNNIANVGTTGFKRSRADFGDIFATSPLQKASSVIGQGVALKQVSQEFSQGNIQFSANSLDIAITGDGFFPLKSADGLQDIYTRNGTFMLNDSYNVVNAAGQALIAAAVDSSGKADLDNLSKLLIPRKTTGDAKTTTEVQLGLNLPADAKVPTQPFDRNDPTTYNKTTAVTVYDAGGNGYLATVYYRKTQTATTADPTNKWQTYVYIGDTKLQEMLIQSSDKKSGEKQYVNKYGEVRAESQIPPQDIARGVTKLFNLDDLKNPVQSQPATIPGGALSPTLTGEWKNGVEFPTKIAALDQENPTAGAVYKPVVGADVYTLNTRKALNPSATTTTTPKVEFSPEIGSSDFAIKLNADSANNIPGDTYTGNTLSELVANINGAIPQKYQAAFSGGKVTVSAIAGGPASINTYAMTSNTSAQPLQVDANPTVKILSATFSPALNAAGTAAQSYMLKIGSDTYTGTDMGALKKAIDAGGKYDTSASAVDATSGAVTQLAISTKAGGPTEINADYKLTFINDTQSAGSLEALAKQINDNGSLTYQASVTQDGSMVLLPKDSATAPSVPEFSMATTFNNSAYYVPASQQTSKSISFNVPYLSGKPLTLNLPGTSSYALKTYAGNTLEELKSAIDTDTDGLYSASIEPQADGSSTLTVRALAQGVTIATDSSLTAKQLGVDANPGGIVFDLRVDGSSDPVTIDMSYLNNLQPAKKFTGVEIAREMTNAINKAYGDERYFDLSSLKPSAEDTTANLFRLKVGTTEHTISLTEGRYGIADLSKVTVGDAIKAMQAEVDKQTDYPSKVTVGYDPVRQSFTFNTTDNTKVTIRSATTANNDLFGLTNTETAVDGTDGTWGASVLPNGSYVLGDSERRYGIEVKFDETNNRFTISSGTTGDSSSIEISKASAMAYSLFGLQRGDTAASVETSGTPLRGITSQPAVLKGNTIGINLDNKFRVDASNNQFVVTVDNVTGLITMPEKADYTMEEFRTELENRINALGDNFGRTVSGVKVEIGTTPGTNNKFFTFTTGTSGDNSFLKVSANSIWGLNDLPSARGTTSKWIEPPQAKNGDGFPLYVNRDGQETSDPGTFSEDETRDLWSPIYLDKGELTFDSGGNLYSPLEAIAFKSTTIGASGATLQFSIDYASSTQYSSPFSVLKQDQNGRPEGDLIGVDIADNGLVSASYSNGSQKSLAKIVLVNFASPTGLRQIGDASYYATSKSGDAKYGEAGSAGFGTVRAGARERANVDLTAELVELITAQRNFQANAKAIETNNTLTQAIINIRS